MFRTLLCVALVLVSFCSTANASISESWEKVKASISEYWEGLKADVKSTWNDGRISAYIPVYAWHNRLTYDRKHIDKYNEHPWGFGVGLTRDEGDDWHGLYAMGFKDSNDYLETFFGYGYMKNFSLDCYDKWRVGIGYTLGITQRHEYSYIPVPLPLPLVGVGYRRFNIQAAYVPGVKNDGNVLFAFARYEF